MKILSFVAALAVTTALAPPVSAKDAARSADALAEGFRTPPNAARPYVWWHWMNGNISAEGARLDLEWMKRAGIGGVQVFEGNLFTPQLVTHRLAWMTPEWKAALRESASTAQRLGLAFGIASSPGWSISGAPFVKPEAAMKKLVWSETLVTGKHSATVRLAQPPSVAGPFQDIAGVEKVAPFYRDALVLAVPTIDAPLVPLRVAKEAGAADAALLRDGAFGPAEKLAFSKAKPEAWLLQDFGKPVVVRAVTLGLPGTRGFGAPPVPTAMLEASDDGVHFRPVTELPAGREQVRTASFAPVSARYFRARIHLLPSDAALIGTAASIPGLVPLHVAAPPATEYAVSELTLFAQARVNHAAEKAGFAAADDYYALATPEAGGPPAIRAKGVIDVTRFMRADGVLDWKAPAGDWTVLRFGYALTGHQNGPAPVEATGLEVDKLDAAAVRDYAETYLGLYEDAVGGKGLGALLSDSIEAGPQNWTPEMIPAFRRLRGYDPVPWLPALTGRIVDSAQATDRFLWDFRRTIAELIAQNHYAVLADAAHRHGMTYYAEALEDHRPQLGDDLAMRSAADVPMGALWVMPAEGGPRQTFIADLQGAASVAHAAGKPFVAAETFTAFGAPWGFAPRDLKATADIAFSLGVNRVMIHTSPHQPRSDLKPGMSMAPLLGQYFSRNETWAEMARGWTDYLARSSYLLQQGRFVADVAYFAGEEAPLTALYGEVPVAVPAGRGFDFVNAEVLAGAKVAADGALVTRGGARYPMLMLGGSSQRMTLATLMRLRDLVGQGATLVGARPQGSPSLADDDAAFQSIADRLWSADGAGRGHVYARAEDAFSALRLDRDWQMTGVADGALGVLHRQLDDGQLWFVSNRSGKPVKGEMSLRANGYAPELWSAETGEIRPVAYRIEKDRTLVSLDLARDDAVFVVLRHPVAAQARTAMAMPERELLRLDEGWTLSLPGVGASRGPLASWADAPDPAHRYFSGTGTYRQDISVRADWLKRGNRVLLDLGEVRDVAAVRINGQPAGIAWKPPFRLDITAAVRAGKNAVEIDVANLWVNRLIGDAQPGAKPTTVTDGPTYTADAKLRPSGLLSPVRLIGRAEP